MVPEESDGDGQEAANDAAQTPPTITAVVITRNRGDLLARTLATVLQQDLTNGSFEVIVVDDGSSDATPQLLERFEDRHDLRVLRQPPRAVSAARNAGIEAARGRVVVFLDDDLLCEPRLLEAHARAHAASAEPLIVVGRLGVARESPSRLVAAWLATVAASAHARRTHDTTLRDAFVAANCSVPLALLRSCGGFDETFAPAREEHELGLRLVRAGARPVYEPEAHALEVVGKPIERLVHDAGAVGRDEVALCRRYPEYRPYSPLARVADGPWWKAKVRELTTRSRLLNVVALEAPARLVGTVVGDKGAAALTGARHGVALRRGAVSAAGSWGSLREQFGRRLPVLCFHRVGPPVEGANPDLTVTPARFKAQLRLLSRLGYVPVTAQSWIAWCRSGEPVPERPVLVTFDDAYADLTAHAFPVLAEAGYPATLFAPSACLGGENTWDETLQAGLHPVTHRLLDPADLRAWLRRGIEVGAHSRTHARLTEVDSDELVLETVGSRQELERTIDAPVVTFAYPFGAVDGRVRTAASESFDAAFTIEEGVNTLATDPFLLLRSVVQPTDTTVDVLFRLWLGWSPVERLRRRLIRARSR